MAYSHLQENKELCVIYFDVISFCMFGLSAVAMIPTIYKYVTSGTKKTRLFYVGLVFFIVILLAQITEMLSCLVYCHNAHLYRILSNLFSQLFSINSWCLLLFLFLRLHSVFHDSAWTYSTCTVRVWCILLSICGIVLIAAGIANANYQHATFGVLILGLAFVSILILIIYVNCLFIYKLVEVYKSVESDSKLIATITKTSLLAFISTSCSILVAIFGVIGRRPGFQSIHTDLIVSAVIALDLNSNFWCTLLSYRYFHAWYMTLCCHSKCTRICSILLARDTAMMQAVQIDSQTNADSIIVASTVATPDASATSASL